MTLQFKCTVVKVMNFINNKLKSLNISVSESCPTVSCLYENGLFFTSVSDVETSSIPEDIWLLKRKTWLRGSLSGIDTYKVTKQNTPQLLIQSLNVRTFVKEI